MDPQELGWGSRDWIGLAQNREMFWVPVNAEMNLRVPQNMEISLRFVETGPVSFSEEALIHAVQSAIGKIVQGRVLGPVAGTVPHCSHRATTGQCGETKSTKNIVKILDFKLSPCSKSCVLSSG